MKCHWSKRVTLIHAETLVKVNCIFIPRAIGYRGLHCYMQSLFVKNIYIVTCKVIGHKELQISLLQSLVKRITFLHAKLLAKRTTLLHAKPLVIKKYIVTFKIIVEDNYIVTCKAIGQRELHYYM